MLLSN